LYIESGQGCSNDGNVVSTTEKVVHHVGTTFLLVFLLLTVILRFAKTEKKSRPRLYLRLKEAWNLQNPGNSKNYSSRKHNWRIMGVYN